ncbi:hypothetical protein ACHAXM_001315 [Skeletonema potamos]
MNNNNKLITKAAAVLMGMATIVRVAFYEAEMPLLYHSLRGNSRGKHSLYIPTSLDSSAQRRLSIDLGGGACEWQPPEYEIPNDIDFFKTLIAGFPSCDKRMTFIQMEALTGWAAVDEWDLYRGYSNHPFIKSNYPHHEGIWSWGSQVDQVVMVVRNIRRTMVEYHDILWDIATAKNSGVSDVEVLYKYAPPISSFFKWRDARVIDEISWYGWFIDYWMEGGLQRDIYTHQLTTPEAWPLAPGGNDNDPPSSPPAPPVIIEQDTSCQDNSVWHRSTIQSNTCDNTLEYPTEWNTPGNVTYLFASASECCQYTFPDGTCTTVDVCPTLAPTPNPTPPPTPPPTQPQASYDPQCTSGRITNGCTPVAVVSAEKLRDFTDGPAETTRIANVLMKDTRISQYMISQEAWGCIWTELIQNGKGIRTVTSREGWVESDYSFSGPMLQKMINELDRLIAKYSSPSWNTQANANRLVELLVEHRGLIQIELNDVTTGLRRLEERDFLGPEERSRMYGMEGRRLELEEGNEAQDMEYFMALEQKMAEMKRSEWQALYSTKGN